MSQIEIPDWVVELACHAMANTHGQYIWPHEWMDGDDDTAVRHTRDKVRAALSAALEGWLVPAGYLNKWDDGDETVSARPAHPEDGLAQPLYTLRKEPAA